MISSSNFEFYYSVDILMGWGYGNFGNGRAILGQEGHNSLPHLSNSGRQGKPSLPLLSTLHAPN
jgi:hypothetical protein